MRYLGALLLALLLVSPAAAAPPKRPTLLLGAVLADAQTALADAQAHNDTIAAGCYEAIIVVAKAKIDAQSVRGGGLLTAFQRVRDVQRVNTGSQGVPLVVACAPLAQASGTSITGFFTNMGALAVIQGLLLP